MDDDLNTAQALGAMFELVRDANTAIDAGEFRQGNVTAVLDCVERWNRLFDVLPRTGEPGKISSDAPKDAPKSGLSDAEVEQKLQEREQARQQRNFARADEIRRELAEAGILMEDTKDGTRWRRK
jgi:cysteinyl-tRNA synthetase